MSESTLTPLLFQGISRELQDMLLHNPPPSQEFSVYASYLQKLDNRYHQHQQQVSRNRTPIARAFPSSYAAAAKPTVYLNVTAKQPNSPRSSLLSLAPMYKPIDLSS